MKFEEAMTKVEGIEEALNTVLDTSSEGIISGEAFGDEKIEEVAKLLEEEAGAKESELDKKIKKKMKNIEDMMMK